MTLVFLGRNPLVNSQKVAQIHTFHAHPCWKKNVVCLLQLGQWKSDFEDEIRAPAVNNLEKLTKMIAITWSFGRVLVKKIGEKIGGKMAVSSLELQVFMWVDGCGRSSSSNDPQEIPSRTTPSSSFSAKGSTKSFCSWCNSSTNSRRGDMEIADAKEEGYKTWKLTSFPLKKVEKRSFRCEMAPF